MTPFTAESYIWFHKLNLLTSITGYMQVPNVRHFNINNYNHVDGVSQFK